MNTFADGRLEVMKGDITKLNVDAVVNAANSSLMGGGGVDGAIHRAGGPEILNECKKIRSGEYPEGLPAGEAVITGAGKLPTRYVIHTVGPVWHGGNDNEEATLQRCYENCLSLAAKNTIRRIAFPAISTGVYGFPKDKAARIAFNTITGFLNSGEVPETVILVFFAQDDMDTFLSAVE